MADKQAHKTDDGESSNTVVVETEETVTTGPPSVRMKLKKPKAKKKVAWSADTVDNENMDKKKSKCCCIYEKPKVFGESSSESDDECEHCKGHVEQKKEQSPAKENASQDENHIQSLEPDTK